MNPVPPHPLVLHARDASAAAIAELAQRLRDGALAVIPTDTVYGLAAHPDRPEAVARLFAIKGREAAKPIPLLIASTDDARRYGAVFTPPAERLAARFWPGALTLVLPLQSRPEATEGFRVPDSPVTRALLTAAGGVLRVTSANRSGEPPATTATEAREALGDTVDAILDAGPAPIGVASTVAAVRANGVHILRAGAIDTPTLRAAGVDVFPP